jgi:hypothetical protein
MVVLAVTVWLLVGLAIIVNLLDRRELVDFLGIVAGIALWPVVLVSRAVEWRRRRRREADRQARITAKVVSGEYTTEWARRLGWKGADRG